jgi:hypothetical protein
VGEEEEEYVMKCCNLSDEEKANCEGGSLVVYLLRCDGMSVRYSRK